MDQANIIVEVGGRSTKTEAGEIGDALKFLRKDACDDSLANSNSDSGSGAPENVDALAELNDLALRRAYRTNKRPLEAVAMSFMGIAAWRANIGAWNRVPNPRAAMRGKTSCLAL